jgi:hypothetical protein
VFEPSEGIWRSFAYFRRVTPLEYIGSKQMASTGERKYRLGMVLALSGLVALALFALLAKKGQMKQVPLVAPTLDKSRAVHKAAFRLLEQLHETVPEHDETPLQSQRQWAVRDPLEEELLSLSRGSLSYAVPTTMETGETETIIAKIGDSSVSRDLMLDGLSRDNRLVQTQQTPISLKMVMKLSGKEFAISPSSEQERPVGGPYPSIWVWQITPEQSGDLHLILEGRIELKNAVGEFTTIEREINVRVNYGYESKKFITGNWKWMWGAAGTLISGCIAFYFQIKRKRTPGIE